MKIGGVAASLSAWTDTQIRGIIPEGLGPGNYAATVVRSPPEGVVTSNEVQFGVGGSGGMVVAGLRDAAKPSGFQAAGLPLSPQEGGKVEAASRASVQVPPGALERDAVVTLAMAADDAARSDALRRQPLAAAGDPVEFGPEGLRFSQPAVIELPYDPATIPVGREGSLAIHWWDGANKTWVALATEVDGRAVRLRARVEHFSVYQPMVTGMTVAAAAQDSFGMREVYAFPNPARGQNPTIRVQAGAADSVDIRIYDTSGQLKHSATVTAAKLLDDGNGKGQQWTFDYEWEAADVGSGVYIYSVTAYKAGQTDLKATKKVAVIQ